MPIVRYDVLGQIQTGLIDSKLRRLMTNEEVPVRDLLDQIKDLGYDTYSPVDNLGSLTWYFFFTLLKIPLIIVLWPFSYFYKTIA